MADCGIPENLHLPEEAYPENLPQAAEYLNERVTQDEVETALYKLHNGRAKSPQWASRQSFNTIPSYPARKANPSLSTPILTSLIDGLFYRGIVPINGSLITPVYKTGDPFDTAHYRPIAVIEPIMRMYAGILNAGLMHYTEEQSLQAKSQTGFKSDPATTYQLLAMQHFIRVTAHAGAVVCMRSRSQWRL